MKTAKSFVKRTATNKFLAKYGKRIDENKQLPKTVAVLPPLANRGIGFTRKNKSKSKSALKMEKNSRRINRKH